MSLFKDLVSFSCKFMLVSGNFFFWTSAKSGRMAGSTDRWIGNTLLKFKL